MSHADGERVGGIRGWGFRETEQGTDHESDLGFIGGALADDSHFHLFRRVFVNPETMVCGGDESCSASGSHGDCGLVGLDVNDPLDSDLVGLEFLDDVHQVRSNRGKRGRVGDALGDGNYIEGEDGRSTWIAIEHGVSGVSNRWIDGEDSHMRWERAPDASDP